MRELSKTTKTASQEAAIKVHGISKTFRLPVEARNSFKSLFVSGFRKSRIQQFKVLNNISFEIKKGEFFGIMGRNGSGKSTLLKLLAGIYTPDNGSIVLNGSLTPFIELGVGFNHELTGRENVFLNGALLGFSREEMEVMYPQIVEFAELEKFMDQKLKNYSSGMQVRLAFSIAIQANTDILLIDEVLAVGDTLFQKKCFNYFKELKNSGKTVILISHNSSSLEEYCSQGILIENGSIISAGKISKVVHDYIDMLNKEKETSGPHKESGERWGIGGMQVIQAHTSDGKKNKTLFTDQDSFLNVHIQYRSSNEFINPVYGITITDASGQRIFQSNTLWSKLDTKSTRKDEVTKVEWIIPNFFNNGIYYISPAVADAYGSTIYDWRDNFVSFEISKTLESSAILNAAHKIIVVNG